EDALDLLEDLPDDVARSDGADDAGERKVDALAGQRRLFGAGLDCRAAFFDLGFNVRAQFVELLADRALELRRSGFQPVVGDPRQCARFPAKPCIAVRLPGRLVLRGTSFAVEPIAHFSEEFGDLLLAAPF